jgi:hypothetical protein
MMKPSLRTVSFLLCVVLVSSPAAQAAQAVQIEIAAPASSIPNPVVRNVPSARSAFPQTPSSIGPGNGRLYLGMAAVAGLGVGLIAYGSGNSTQAVGDSVRYCIGTQCGTVRDLQYVTVNRTRYTLGGVALVGIAAFGIYAIHKWRR